MLFMITVISGTNRPDSKSVLIARHYQTLLQELGQETTLLDLAHLPHTFTAAEFLYAPSLATQEFAQLSRFISEGRKFVVVVPEYNASYPGVLKAFIDGLEYPASFKNKKVGMIGVSSGSQGGILAMSHLTDVFHYLGAEVLSYKPRLPAIHKNISAGQLTNPNYDSFLREHAAKMVAF